MALEMELIPLAIKEFRKAVSWYEDIREDLAIEFIQSVNRLLSEIHRTPERWPLVFKDMREAILPKWKYAIYYRITPKTIRILSIFHTSRNPIIWKRRK